MSLRIETTDGEIRVVRHADMDATPSTGRVVDLRGEASVATVHEAIGSTAWIVTDDPPPVGTALAVAARSRGHTPPQADRIAELEETLTATADSADGADSTDSTVADSTDSAVADGGDSTVADSSGGSVIEGLYTTDTKPRVIPRSEDRVPASGVTRGLADSDTRTPDGEATDNDTGTPNADAGSERGGLDLETARQEAAETGTDVERLREEVATVRGRLLARESIGEPTEAVQSELTDEIRELTDVETEQFAAQQRLTQARQRARERRDTREQQLRRRDAVRNRRREARKWLARQVYDAFADALDRLPGTATAGDRPEAFSGDPVTGYLGAIALDDRDRPVVLAVDRFASPQAASEQLSAPVVRVNV